MLLDHFILCSLSVTHFDLLDLLSVHIEDLEKYARLLVCVVHFIRRP